MDFEFDPYSMLGVSSDASVDEIKSAYRRIARRLHPDSNPNNPGAAAQFTDITMAHNLLSDPIQKRQFDEKRNPRDPNDLEFTLRVTPSKRTITALAETQVIYLLAELFPDARAQHVDQPREARVNLTLVLDHSNSMSGARIENVKRAAHQIIDNLSENDFLSVITFNDRANTVIPAAPIADKPALKARVSLMTASGGTEIFQGLSAGVEQNQVYRGSKLVNHIILLTDGHTFGDQDRCMELAEEANKQGISISAMGLGHDWNDAFLDQLASKTGGTSEYINSPNAVVQFLNDQVRNLSNAFAERIRLSVAPDADVVLEMAFKLSPTPQPLEITDGHIPLGSMQANRPIAVLLQFQLPANMENGFRSVSRLVATGDILGNEQQAHMAISDISLEVTQDHVIEEPPAAILDALSKLTLYRLQERAQEALERGDFAEATRRLQNLATRLLEMGEEALATQAMIEAKRVAHTNIISDKGRKEIKYQTRALVLSTAIISSDDLD